MAAQNLVPEDSNAITIQKTSVQTCLVHELAQRGQTTTDVVNQTVLFATAIGSSEDVYQ
jgi:hypothetical protein